MSGMADNDNEENGGEASLETGEQVPEDALEQDGAAAGPRGAGPATPDERRLRAWIARIVDQDQAALAALYDELIGPVYGLAFKITRHAGLAEEVAQDAFWQIWRQAPRYDPARGSALAWVMVIVRSRALDELRRTDTQLCELEPDTLADLDSGGDDDPQELLSALQQRQIAHEALAQLDPVPRRLLSLAFLRGLSHGDIASQEGMPLGTVKTHIRRGLAKLRAWLAPADDESDPNR